MTKKNKRFIVFLLAAVAIFLCMVGSVAAEETINQLVGETATKTLYRYREKTTTTSKTNLDEPWILSDTTTEYEHSSFATIVLEDTETIGSAYCVHKKERVDKYVKADGSLWFYATPSEYFDRLMTNTNMDLGSYIRYDGYYRYTYCRKKTSYNLYHYYKWSDWSEWSETPVSASENVEVETKIVDIVTISYDANGGTDAPESVTKRADEIISLSTVIPVKEDYQFLGWSTTAGGDVEYAPGSECSADKSITLYAIYKNIFMNRIAIDKDSNNGSVNAGEKEIAQKFIFATDKSAKYFICTVKYSNDLILAEIKSETFEIEQEHEVIGNDTYIYLTCIYNGDIPFNQTITAFELIFDVSENAAAYDILTVEILDDAILADDYGNTYKFENVENVEFKVNPILATNIEIVGADEIDCPTTYTASVLPKNATNKEVEWSVSDETVATISWDGTLTPIKKGSVTITAKAKDGSGVTAEKTVTVKVFTPLTSISTNIGMWDKEYSYDIYDYTIYMPKDAQSIKLTALHGGKLTSLGKTYINNIEKSISLTGDETILNLKYTCDGYDDIEYTITIIKFEGTKTIVSDDGKEFVVNPINVEEGNTVILALYCNDYLVEMQSAVYNGESIVFNTDKNYTDAKIMVWEQLSNLQPVTVPEVVN